MNMFNPSSQNSVMICAPIMAESVEQVVSEMNQAKQEGADIVEVRLDYIMNLQPRQDLQIILQNKPLPLIVVFRPKWEGGRYEGDEQMRLEILHLARELRADYVDCEFRVASDFIRTLKRTSTDVGKLIVSTYINGVTPSKQNLSDLVKNMETTGPDLIKIVFNATDITEIQKIFCLSSHCQVPLIAYSIGERGLISQILAPKYGGNLVYGSLKGYKIPGLTTLHNLREVYQVKSINADTKIFGLISKPVSHSKGPILHNPSFKHVNENAVYVPMFVDDLSKFFRVYSGPDFLGFSVGIPYKEAILPFCDEVDPLAQSIGAVNTIIRRLSDGKLIGYNTDCEASITASEDALKEHGCSFEDGSPLSGKQFVLVGAGGAGRAVGVGAKTRGARIVVFDIDFDRANSLACAVSGEARPFEDLLNFRPEKGAILANATPLGMYPNKDRIPISQETFGDYLLVFDSVYTPRKTRLLQEAETGGAIVVSGVEMFLRQAIGQFNLFTQKPVPEAFMREIVLSEF